ncbi:hypothetical protein BDZ45DRAFT_753644 [Acephala macrosclerotiorum]|nr:hypothetical protein BDZ45DRAFT_753644 [Acephala macrosclerotiorum]
MASDDRNEGGSNSGGGSDIDDLDLSLSSMAMLKLPELKKHLKKDGVSFNDNDQKADLQAITALWKLGKLVSGEKAPRDAVETTAEWCKMSVSDLKKVMDKRKVKYKEKEPRWTLLEHLIDDEFGSFDDKPTSTAQKGSKKAATRGATPKSGKSSATQSVPKLAPEDIDPAVVNLLISAIYNSVFITKRAPGNIRGYKTKEYKVLLEALDNIPLIEDAAQLEELLSGSSTASIKVLRQICEEYGSRFVALADKHRFPGFEDDLPQFAILGSTGEPSTVRRKSGHGPSSALLFHGTPLDNLLPTLLNGFDYPDGLCVTSEPNHAVSRAQNIWQPKRSYWKNSPFENHAALLGLQVAAQEEPLPYEEIMIKHQSLATVRYLFLVPPPAFGPPRKIVESLMLAGLKSIREGDGRSLGKEEVTV